VSSGRLVVGIAVLVVGVAALLDALAVDVPWELVLPAALIVIGLFLLLNPTTEGFGGWVVVGGVLTVILLVGTFAGFSVSVSSGDNIEQANFAVDEPVERIIVSIDAGSVEVVVDAGAGVIVERRLIFDDDRPEVSHSIEDGELRVEADCPVGFFRSACSVDHLLRVPGAVDIEIETSAGTVTVSGIEGEVRVDTGSGSIELVDLSGEVQAESGAGGIVLEGLSGDTAVDTGSGSVRGTRLTTPTLFVDTGSGSIDLQFETSPGDIDLEAGSGSVTVIVPVGSYRLDLDTGSGSTEYTGIIDDASSDQVIRASTGSGSIRVVGK
jgi:hypothetical protein